MDISNNTLLRNNLTLESFTDFLKELTTPKRYNNRRFNVYAGVKGKFVFDLYTADENTELTSRVKHLWYYKKSVVLSIDSKHGLYKVHYNLYSTTSIFPYKLYKGTNLIAHGTSLSVIKEIPKQTIILR